MLVEGRMPDVIKTDICILGASPGGLQVAAAAAALKIPVALVEPGLADGGWPASGSARLRALAAAGSAARKMRSAARFGLPPHAPIIDFDSVLDHVRARAVAVAVSDSPARYEAMGARVIRAAGRFSGSTQIEAGGVTIKARRVVIAAMSSPHIPAIAGLGALPFLTADSIFDLKTLPRKLLIIGAGAAGLELGQAFRRLGSEVEILDKGEPLADLDRELAGVTVRALRREGVIIRANVEIQNVSLHGEGARASYLANGIAAFADATHLLVATGRKVSLDPLRLGAARVSLTPDGIAVNGAMQNPGNPKVYAIGEAAGAGQAHLASYHASLVIRHALLRLPVSGSKAPAPLTLLTDPEIAYVGLSEAQARAAHARLSILRFPFSENDRALTDGQSAGLIKVIAAPDGKILGCGIAGPQAAELITPWTLALAQGLSVRQMAETVFPAATLSDASRRAALSWFGPKLAQPGFGRVLRFLRFWG